MQLVSSSFLFAIQHLIRFRLSKIPTPLPDLFSSTRAAMTNNNMDKEILQVKLLNVNATMPKRGSPLSAGFDLSASEPIVIPPHCRAIVKTGISIACPAGTYARIAPRSGLAVKNFIDTGAGVVDADYRGEVGVVLFNFGDEPFSINRGDRIAQLILEKICMAQAVQVEELDDTERGAGGYGSTGVSLADLPTKKRPVSPTDDCLP
jgi:deoxyuridine 5'-triphosphate nucleotidohydrolase